jgi:hypothetical protein
MTDLKALLISKGSSQSQKSGIAKRLDDISTFLTEIGFEVERVSDINSSKAESYDLICISSFSNAFQIFSARKKTNYLWYDAMDSWRLTRRTLFLDNPFRECLKICREVGGRLFVGLPNIITYCSLRDAKYDKSNFKKTLIFGPGKVCKFELKDFGKRFVFVGPSEYFPNREAVTFLFKIARSNSFVETKLHISGEAKMYKEVHPDVFIHGIGKDSDIYGQSDIHLVPIWAGAGIKYKTFTPLSLGVKVISSFEGANGLDHNPNMIVCDSEEDFETAIDRLSQESTSYCQNSSPLVLDQRELLRQNILNALKS